MNTQPSIPISTIHEHFPALLSHPEIVYFDNAATTQKPQSVLDAVLAYHHHFCANPHSAQHDWATKSTKEIEKVREQVADFIGANLTIEEKAKQGKKYTGSIFFTSGATHASELLADTFLNSILDESATIIHGEEDHNSLGKKWTKIAEKYQKKCTFLQIKTNQEGFYSLSSFVKCLNQLNTDTKKTVKNDKTQKPPAAVLVTHVHNVFGVEMALEEIREKTPTTIPIILDASQSAGHISISVQELGVAAVYFSGHKLFSFAGVGVLWISDAFAHHFDTQDIEAGTPAIEAIISLGAAISFIQSVGIKKIEQHLLELTQYCIKKLRDLPDIEFLPGPAFCRCAAGHGIISFRKIGTASAEVADWLNSNNIFVRAGNHCTSLSVTAASASTATATATTAVTEDSVRVSMQAYNTKKEVDMLYEVLKKI